MSVISRKKRITIPAQVLREAGLGPGDDVRVRPLGPGRAEIVRTEDVIAQFAGCLTSATYPPDYTDDVRTGWL